VARSRTGHPQVLSAKICDVNGHPLDEPVCTEPFLVRLHFVLPEDAPGTQLGIGILSADGLPLFTSNTWDVDMEAPTKAGEYEADVLLPANCLLADTFHVAMCLWNDAGVLDLQEPAFSFSVDPGGSHLYQLDSQRKGFVHIDCQWEVRKLGTVRGASAG
ncbi:MAG: Wzt carbohydrate-binding domain-containing protein, partial [Acidobacteria bacterium]|nr:Wzt carbohydrate-binding domain-containing protein [Acidobacteriota bacterium]